MSEPPSLVKRAALVLGPLFALVGGWLLVASGSSYEAGVTLGVTLLCIVWWMLEPIPIPATSLIPIAVLPLTGVLPQSQVSEAYGNQLVLLLLGGFILSTAMEKSGAHLRVALIMVRAFGGTSSKRLVAGFAVASAMLSMWISNTATTLMLLPVAMAVIERARDEKLQVPLLLGVAYAASIGGIGTPIGTPPNVIFMGIYQSTTGNVVSFTTWMSWGVPVVLVLVPLMVLWVSRGLTYRGTVDLPEVGAWRSEEKRTLAVFAVTALLWITRSEPLGGWAALLDVPYTNDGIVALLAVIAMFLIPNGLGGRLLDWETAERIPWGMLLLFAGGITIAGAFESSGLSVSIGNAFAGVATWHTYAVIMTVCLVVTFLTETTSNTATTALLMPILAAAALGAAIDPRLMMVPAAMSASCAFMLPVGTTPNIIVFSSGRFPLSRMVKEGSALNFIGAFVIGTLCYVLLID